MLRLTLLPLFFLISALVVIVLAYFVLKKLGSGLSSSVNKGKQVAKQKQRDWQQRWQQYKQKRKTKKEQKEKLPEIIQKGRTQFTSIESYLEGLPEHWQKRLEPIITETKNILDEVTAEALIEYDAEKKSHYPSERLNSIRPFFNHSLDSLLQFVKKLNSNQNYMDEPASAKALQNITAFKADLKHYRDILDKSRKLDFDIIMDVINARLRQ